MRLRILKSFYYLKQKRNYIPGEIVNMPEEDARLWLRHGMAMQDKSLDGASKTKVETKTEIKPKSKKKIRR